MTSKQILDSSHANGNGKGASKVKDLNTVWTPAQNTPPAFEPDNQPIILERPSWWSHAFVWMILTITGSALVWAAVAPIEQSVPVQGKLEAEGAAKEIKAPNGGVVREVLVKSGQKVYKDQLLIKLDTTAPQADLDGLKKQRDVLRRENDFYNTQFNGVISGGNPEFQGLLKSKISLLNENKFYQALLNGASVQSGGGDEFLANQQGLLEANRAEKDSREQAAQLQVQELQKQLAQVQVQLQATQLQLPIAQQQLETAKVRIEMAQVELRTAAAQLPKAQEQLGTAKAQLPRSQQQLAMARAQLPKAEERAATARALLNKDKSLLDRILPVARQGAIAELQVTRQEQQVLSRQQEVGQAESDILTRQNEIAAREADILTRQQEVAAREADILTRYQQIAASQSEMGNRRAELSNRQADMVRVQAEVERLKGEQQRIEVEIARASKQLENARALSKKEIRTKIADNQQRVADIDSQLARLRLENKKRLDEIDSQIQKAEQAVQFQELRSPVDGVVFNLKPTGPGYVVRPIDAEPVLTIVPNDNLVASVNLTNRDIGFVREGMDVQVNVEPFPSTEYGTIPGKVVSLGKDALPPSQERPYYAFPVKIELDRQYVEGNGRKYTLQSGMAVNASIKVRQRTVLSIFTELFQKQKDSLESVR